MATLTLIRTILHIFMLSWFACQSTAFSRNRRSTTISDFAEEPQDVVAALNTSVTLQCASSHLTNVEYFWKFNDAYINFEKSPAYSLENGGKRLRIFLLVHSLVGHYQCVFRSTFGALASRAALVQLSFIRIISGGSSNANAANGSYVLFRPTVIQSSPSHEYIWRQIEPRGTINASTLPNHIVSANGDLFIQAVKASAKYQLTVRNPLYQNNQEFNLANVVVTVTGNISAGTCPENKLELVSPVQNVTVNSGASSVTLDCLVASKRCWSSPSVKWILGNGKVQNGHRLSIQNPTASDAKRYTCEATNDGVTKQFYFWVFVRGLPRWTQTPLKFLTLNSDGTISSGKYTGATEVEWFLDGDKIKSSSDFFRITPENNLEIKRFSALHAGTYQIFLKNEAGVSSTSLQVTATNACGSKLIGNKGVLNVTSVPSSSQPLDCGWVFQLPSTGEYTFLVKHLKFNGASSDCTNTKLSLVQKSRLPLSESWLYCIWDATPKAIPTLSGPYVILQAKVRSEYLAGDGGFAFSYELKNPVITTKEPTTTLPPTLPPTTPGNGNTGKQKEDDALPVWIVGLVSGLGAVLILLAFCLYIVWRRRQKHTMPQAEANGNIESRKNPYNHVSIKAIDSPSVKPILEKNISETSFGDPDVPMSRVAVSRKDRPTLSQSYSDPFNQVDVPVYSVCGTPDYQNVPDALPVIGKEGTVSSESPSQTTYYNSLVPDYETPYEPAAEGDTRDSGCYDYPYDSNVIRRPGLTNGGFQENDDDDSSQDDSSFEQPEYETPYESSVATATGANQPENHYAQQNLEPYEPALYEPLEPNRVIAGSHRDSADKNYADLQTVVPKNSEYQSFKGNFQQQDDSQMYDVPEATDKSPENNYQALKH